MSAIVISDLSKTYRGKRGATVPALSGLSLEVERGQVFGFLGPNGAGKSTTIKVLTGQIHPSAGAAMLLGRPVVKPVARSRVGYLPENPAFYGFLSAREFLAFAGRCHGMTAREISTKSAEVLARLELTAAANRPVKGYSKGMVQRLGLAQALLHDPELLILDEPMSGLDPLGRALVKRLILELRGEGKTVFFSTHITSDIEVLCDRVGVLVAGRLVAEDTVGSILAGETTEYLLQIRSGGGEVVERTVGCDMLQAEMEKAWGAGWTVERIEPKRRDMEAFFLEVVSRRG